MTHTNLFLILSELATPYKTTICLQKEQLLWFVIFLDWVKMKTRLLIILAIILVPLNTNVSDVCDAETLQWWEACNDTGPNNALHLNPVLLLIIIVISVLIIVIIGIKSWRKRKMTTRSEIKKIGQMPNLWTGRR